jgi:hypothetical protein
VLGANTELMLLRAYALAQTHRVPVKLMKIPDNSGSDPPFLTLTQT